MKRAFGQKQIPTLLGLGVLIAALIGGIALIGTGGGVFAPRATPQTTPKLLKITNIKDTSFSVSFITDEATNSFIKYGKSATDLKSQAADDRDQLNGNVGQYNSHYITVRDLDPDTQYFFTVGTATVPVFDNNGAPFNLKTAKKGGNPTAAKTAYGTVNTASGTPADGAIVYLSIDGVSELSGLVKSSGSWAIPLSNARTTDLLGYANLKPADPVTLMVQGTQVNQVMKTALTVADIQPAQTLVLGAGSDRGPAGRGQTAQGAPLIAPLDETNTSPIPVPSATASAITQVVRSATDSAGIIGGSEGLGRIKRETATASAIATASPTIKPVLRLGGSISTTSSLSTSPTGLPAAGSQQPDTVDLKIAGQQIVETSKPTITGQVTPNTIVTVEIHSDTQITTLVKSDSSGNFTLPLGTGDTALEPGEHTITITYTDPTTGQQKTSVRTFTVAAAGSGSTTAATTTTSTSTTTGATTTGQASTTTTGSSTTTAGTSELLALAQTSPVPYGTDNPYALPSSTPSGTTGQETSTASASPRVSMPTTSSDLPQSGSVETTIALIIGGCFLIGMGVWSYKNHTLPALTEDEDEDAAV